MVFVLNSFKTKHETVEDKTDDPFEFVRFFIFVNDFMDNLVPDCILFKKTSVKLFFSNDVLGFHLSNSL